MINQHINTEDFHNATSRLREFFLAKGFLEVHTQSRKSILAACEDPATIATYEYEGKVWPLPQTGQMWLEYELLENPQYKGVFCQTTSYRQEPNPVPGRHETIFPMFEFESHGGLKELEKLERELLEFLGFGNAASIPSGAYTEMAKTYKTIDICGDTETKIGEDFGNTFLLTHFPRYTSPFWNMKFNETGTIANKIDVLMYGMETIGSAERSCNVDQMREIFHTISDGEYANLLFKKFGKERVEAELEEFLSHDFFPRFGGGIGVTRMIRALKMLEAEKQTELKVA